MNPILTVAQRNLLKALNDVEGGCLPAEWIRPALRSLATKMQGKGLVQWKAPAFSRRWTCKGQTLHITEKGVTALLEQSR